MSNQATTVLPAVATQLTENRQRGRESRRGAKYFSCHWADPKSSTEVNCVKFHWEPLGPRP